MIYSLLFTPDSRTLISSSDHDGIQSRDTETGKATDTIKAGSDAVFALSLSSNGSLLASAGEGDYICIWDFHKRNKLHEIKAHNAKTSVLAFAPDGKTIVSGHDDGRMYLWDIETERQVQSRKGHDSAAYTAVFDGTGKRVVSRSEDGTVRIWDLRSGEQNAVIEPLSKPYEPPFPALFSPGGDNIAAPSSKNGICFWDAASGKQLRSIPIQLNRASSTSFSSDLCLCAVEHWNWNIDIHDLASNKLIGVFSIKPEQVSGANAEGSFLMSRMLFSFDKHFFAVVSIDGLIHLWDVPGGKVLKKLSTHQRSAVCLAFSHDNRLLMSCEGADRHPDKRNTQRKHDLVVWDMKTLRPLLEYHHLMGKACAVEFSPDDRSFILVSDDGSIRLIETCSCKEMLRYRITEPLPRSGSFSPSGGKIVTAMSDGTIFLWTLSPSNYRASTSRLSPLEMDHYWSDLAADDSHRFYLAVCALSDHPSDVIQFFSKRLRPIPRVDSRLLEKLILDLDSDVFSRREQASRELARLGHQVELALRSALENKPSTESRRRIENLLKALPGWLVKDPEILRILRAIWILQRIGTPEARALLEKLASGAPAARQTQEAKSALQFLDRLKRR